MLCNRWISFKGVLLMFPLLFLKNLSLQFNLFFYQYSCKAAKHTLSTFSMFSLSLAEWVSVYTLIDAFFYSLVNSNDMN